METFLIESTVKSYILNDVKFTGWCLFTTIVSICNIILFWQNETHGVNSSESLSVLDTKVGFFGFFHFYNFYKGGLCYYYYSEISLFSRPFNFNLFESVAVVALYLGLVFSTVNYNNSGTSIAIQTMFRFTMMIITVNHLCLSKYLIVYYNTLFSSIGNFRCDIEQASDHVIDKKHIAEWFKSNESIIQRTKLCYTKLLPIMGAFFIFILIIIVTENEIIVSDYRWSIFVTISIVTLSIPSAYIVTRFNDKVLHLQNIVNARNKKTVHILHWTPTSTFLVSLSISSFLSIVRVIIQP